MQGSRTPPLRSFRYGTFLGKINLPELTHKISSLTTKKISLNLRPLLNRVEVANKEDFTKVKSYTKDDLRCSPVLMSDMALAPDMENSIPAPALRVVLGRIMNP